MKFEELTPVDLQYLSTVHKNTEIPYDQRIDLLKKRFDVSERTIRRWLKKAKISKFEAKESEQLSHGRLREADPTKKIKFVTYAQNATPVHAKMLEHMEMYAEFLNAEIFVLAGRYQNPTSLWTKNMETDEWWDTNVLPYLVSSRINLHKYVDIIETKVVPTSENPLSGLEGLTAGRSCILGHPRLHLSSLPVLEGHEPKLVLTSGAVTVKNYTDTKAGAKGSFHHCYGFAIVEIKDDEIVYIRQVPVCSDGTFTDLIYNVDGGVYKIDSSAAFVMGDLHVDEVEEDIVKETIRYFKKVRPEKTIVHDIANGTSVNHHESKDPVIAYQKFLEGKNVVKKEVDGIVSFIKKHKLTEYGLAIVSSNHNDWYDRWIKETDWRKSDPANSQTYMEYALAMLQGKTPKGIIAYLLEQEFGSNIQCLGRNESLTVKGVELSQHGDEGANGAKGSIEAFRKLNTKIATSHIHSVHRRDGALTAGTYTILRPRYNTGASAWRWAGIVIHQNSKSQQVIFNHRDKKFTTLF